MSALQEFTTLSSETGLSIARKLLNHRKTEGQKGFAKRAIKYLVKKLKEKLNELEYLVTAVTTHGANASKCVTLQRTSDGRLQISGCTTFPHLIYARIWRWPDLRNHWRELQHVQHCQYAFDLNYLSVCVNPYHYERVISPSLTTGIPILTTPFEMDKSKSEDFVESPCQNKEEIQESPNNKSSGVVCNQVENSGECWCTVAYFEYNIQIGSTFKRLTSLRNMQITGYVHLVDSKNLCLGHIVNHDRSIKSERVRLSIGQGIQLKMKGDSVWLHLLSKHQIFIQSSYLDNQTRQETGKIVYKIYPSSVIKVFDLRQCYQQITASKIWPLDHE
ncbi:MH1 domain containing protein, partial [Asbolus verrucosus]